MQRVIMFLIRKKLGLKKYERFQFVNQRDKRDFYYIDGCRVMKRQGISGYVPSNVSINWLLNEKCGIVKVGRNAK